MGNLKASEVRDALKCVLDPEVGISVVDLGLVYDIKVDAKNNVDVKMTMTSQMCPLANVILSEAQLRIEAIPKVGKVEIELVWDPPWNPSMMSEERRAELGV